MVFGRVEEPLQTTTKNSSEAGDGKAMMQGHRRGPLGSH